jgi:hypothetical protein
MEKLFIKIGSRIVNVRAIAFVEVTDDGGAEVTVLQREQPIRLDRARATPFLDVLSRFLIPVRGD